METSASRRAALIAVTMMSFASPFMLSGVNIGLPAIGAEFGASAVLLTWMSTAYSLATAILLLPCGKLADIYGRKRLFIIGIAVYTLASVLCALAPSAAVLIAFRVIQGFGAAMIFATSTAILTSIYPANERGRVLGINTAAVYLGLSAGPFLGGIIVEALGWRGVFWINVPLAAMALAYTLSRVKGEWADSPGRHLRSTGRCHLWPGRGGPHHGRWPVAGSAWRLDHPGWLRSLRPCFFATSNARPVRSCTWASFAATGCSPCPAWRRWSTTPPPRRSPS